MSEVYTDGGGGAKVAKGVRALALYEEIQTFSVSGLTFQPEVITILVTGNTLYPYGTLAAHTVTAYFDSKTGTYFWVGDGSTGVPYQTGTNIITITPDGFQVVTHSNFLFRNLESIYWTASAN